MRRMAISDPAESSNSDVDNVWNRLGCVEYLWMRLTGLALLVVNAIICNSIFIQLQWWFLH